MRKAVLILIVFVSLVGSAGAQTSVGLIAGEPTGLSARIVLGGIASLDLAVAWSLIPQSSDESGGSLYFHLDYQQYFEQIDVTVGQLLFFVGVGPKLYIAESPIVGARIPLGIFYNFEELPLETFFELVPGLNLFPATRFDVMAAIGLRYQFL